MHSINSKSEYDILVADLAAELADEIDAGVERNIAEHVVASVAVHSGRAVIIHGAEYEGAPLDTLNETLNPYEILTYSDAMIVSGTEANPVGYAKQALAYDLRNAL